MAWMFCARSSIDQGESVDRSCLSEYILQLYSNTALAWDAVVEIVLKFAIDHNLDANIRGKDALDCRAAVGAATRVYCLRVFFAGARRAHARVAVLRCGSFLRLGARSDRLHSLMGLVSLLDIAIVSIYTYRQIHTRETGLTGGCDC